MVQRRRPPNIERQRDRKVAHVPAPKHASARCCMRMACVLFPREWVMRWDSDGEGERDGEGSKVAASTARIDNGRLASSYGMKRHLSN